MIYEFFNKFFVVSFVSIVTFAMINLIDVFMKEISVGYFLRIVLFLMIIGVSYMVFKSLADVLLPFFVAWLLAYLIYPIVVFFQYKLKFKYRLLSIIAVLTLIVAAVTGLSFLVLPSLWGEISQLKAVLVELISNNVKNPSIPPFVSNFVREYANENGLLNILQSSGAQDIVKEFAHKTWLFAVGTINVVVQIFASCIALLYLFFILLDYERLANEWLQLIPLKWRQGVENLMHDLTEGMNQYFRGQALIALIVGVLFSIGFLIIDFPLAIGLGLFIGILNLVPYLQLVSLFPITLLALTKAASTNENFWLILISALIVTMIVQTIQDLILVPRIMGKRMNLHPAVILLSLAIWGKLLGIVGMIVALPLTTLLLGYIKQYHLSKEELESAPAVEKSEKTEKK